jgi:hypothetical protein
MKLSTDRGKERRKPGDKETYKLMGTTFPLDVTGPPQMYAAGEIQPRHKLWKRQGNFPSCDNTKYETCSTLSALVHTEGIDDGG